MSDDNLDEKKLYLVGEGENQVAMPEAEMVRRIEEWYDGLSEEDQKKFRERLWAPIRELGEQQREQQPEAGTEAGTAEALEGPGPDASDRSEQDPSASSSVTIGEYLRNEDRLKKEEEMAHDKSQDNEGGGKGSKKNEDPPTRKGKDNTPPDRSTK